MLEKAIKALVAFASFLYEFALGGSCGDLIVAVLEAEDPGEAPESSVF